MPREDFRQQGPGPHAVSGNLLNKHARMANAVAQGRGGQNANSIRSGTFHADVPLRAPQIGLAVIRGSKRNPDGTLGGVFTTPDFCQQDDDGAYRAPCYELEDGTHIGLYLAAFRYWDTHQNAWLEYPEDITVDTSGYWEGYEDADADSGYATTASANARGPGYGAIPRLWPGEVISVVYDAAAGRAIPLATNLPQDESFIEYVHRRGLEGNMRLLDDDAQVGYLSGTIGTSLNGFAAMVIVHTAFPSADQDGGEAQELLRDSLYWRFPTEECCGNHSQLESSSSGGVPDVPSFLDTRCGFCTFDVGNGDYIDLRGVKTLAPFGDCYVHEATLRIATVGRWNATAQRADQANIGSSALGEAQPRILYGWSRRSTGSGRHTDLPVFCPQGPDYLCPDGQTTEGSRIYFAFRDQNERMQVRIDWKVTLLFIADAGEDLTSTSGLQEYSTSSVSSSSQTVSTSSVIQRSSSSSSTTTGDMTTSSSQSTSSQSSSSSSSSTQALLSTNAIPP